MRPPFVAFESDSLLQQPVYIHFASRAKIHSSVDDDGNDKPRCHSRTVTSVVGLGAVDRLTDLARIESVEHCLAGSAPAFFLRCYPYDCVLVPVGRHRRRRTAIELHAGEVTGLQL